MQTATRNKIEHAPKPKTGVLRNLMHSQFAWIVCIVVCLDLFLWFVKPLRFFDSNFVFADADPLIDKVHAMCSPLTRYNSVVLGSSLAVCAVSVPDFVERGVKPMQQEDLKRYTKAVALDRVLSQSLHTKVESFNASMYGLMMCENLALFKSALKTNPDVKYAVLLIAPRDFLDNFKMPEQKSYIVSFLKDNDLGVFSTSRSFQDNCTVALRQVWRLYDVRSDYNKIVETVTCGWLHRAPSLFAAAASNGDYNSSAFSIKYVGARGQTLEDTHVNTDLLGGTQGYESRYLPIDNAKYEGEIGCLQRFVKLCSDKHVLPIVVNMPLEPSNYQILPKPFLEKYRNDCAKTCSQGKGVYLDLVTSSVFKSPEDFHDNAHLSSRGAKKLYKLIADKVGAEAISH